MMSSKAIGFNRLIRYEWIDDVAKRVVSGESPAVIRAGVLEHLAPQLSGKGAESGRGALQKTSTVLMRIWVTPPGPLMPIRDEAVALMKERDPAVWVPFHWFMTSAVYPFFGDTATAAGRLLRLQNEIRAPDIVQRLAEIYGDRESLHRCARYALRSLVDWEALVDTAVKGIYSKGTPIPLDEETFAWSLRCRLRARNADSTYLSAAVQDPQLFPFTLPHSPLQALSAHGLETVAQGGDSLVHIQTGGTR